MRPLQKVWTPQIDVVVRRQEVTERGRREERETGLRRLVAVESL